MVEQVRPGENVCWGSARVRKAAGQLCKALKPENGIVLHGVKSAGEYQQVWNVLWEWPPSGATGNGNFRGKGGSRGGYLGSWGTFDRHDGGDGEK